MKSDLYTKTVLTVIAIALCVLCFRDVINPRAVSAQAQNQRVIISGVEFDAGTSAARVVTFFSQNVTQAKSIQGVPTVVVSR